jgi:transcriptional regulator with XRE-family HTH domain
VGVCCLRLSEYNRQKMLKKPDKLDGQIKHSYFSKQLVARLIEKQITPTPIALSKAINNHYKTTVAKPHTVRKWLLGQTQPKSETLLLLANWLEVDPKDLISVPNEPVNMTNKVSFEFDFTDQEVISKYLAMTVKEKITVRLLIDAIAEKQR